MPTLAQQRWASLLTVTVAPPDFAIVGAPIDRNHPLVKCVAVRSTDRYHPVTNATEAVIPSIAFA